MSWSRVLDHVCGFEDERVCGFSQDRSDVFDWTRQNHLTQNPKRSANTGPETDRSGTKEGEDGTETVLDHREEPKPCLLLFQVITCTSKLRVHVSKGTKPVSSLHFLT